MTTSSVSLYSRDFGSRPVLVLGGAVVLAALVTVLAFSTGVLLIILAAVLVLTAGVGGFLTATTHLDVTPARVVCRSRLHERAYNTSDLALEQRESNVFVLVPRDKGRKVVCTFADDDVVHVRDAFTAAGVTVEAPTDAA